MTQCPCQQDLESVSEDAFGETAALGRPVINPTIQSSTLSPLPASLSGASSYTLCILRKGTHGVTHGKKESASQIAVHCEGCGHHLQPLTCLDPPLSPPPGSPHSFLRISHYTHRSISCPWPQGRNTLNVHFSASLIRPCSPRRREGPAWTVQCLLCASHLTPPQPHVTGENLEAWVKRLAQDPPAPSLAVGRHPSAP
jgi:hypothetical protein